MAPRLEALATFPEDHIVVQVSTAPFPGDLMPLLSSQVHQAHMWCTDTCRQNTHTHFIKMPPESCFVHSLKPSVVERGPPSRVGAVYSNLLYLLGRVHHSLACYC